RDPYFGYAYIATLTARFITHLWSCPLYPPWTTDPNAELSRFIALIIHYTKLHDSVLYTSLVLLQRLKDRFPHGRGSSGRRLFLVAFMLSCKVTYDENYSNSAWRRVAQSIYSLREINQMEREMCEHLDWDLIVDYDTLSAFRSALLRDFHPQAKEPYPTYPPGFCSKGKYQEHSLQRTDMTNRFPVGSSAIRRRIRQRHTLTINIRRQVIA
ncbi:hypothetical protein DFH06DRAFT_1022155, partial [Mycena polygramma]